MQAIATLRPLTIGQMIDRTVRLYRRNFWTFLGIVALVQVPILVLSLLNISSTFMDMFILLQNPLATPDVATRNPILVQMLSSLVSLASIFLTRFSSAALCLAVIHAMFGETLSIGQAYRLMWERWQSVTGLALSLFIVGAALVIFMFLGFFAFLLPGFMLLGVLLFFTYVAAPLMIPVLMLERDGVWDSMQRTWYLAKRRLWALVGIMFVNMLFVSAMVAGIQVVILTIFGVSIIDSVTTGDVDSNLAATAVATVGVSALASVFMLPIQQGLATILYVDLRVRREGLDLAMAVSAPDSDPLAVLASAPREANGGQLVAGDEFGRFLGLGCAPFLLIVLLYIAIFAIVFLIVGVAGF